VDDADAKKEAVRQGLAAERDPHAGVFRYSMIGGEVTLVFGVDASHDSKNMAQTPAWRGGFALVYRDPRSGELIEKWWRVPRMYTVNMGELAAIVQALEEAIAIVEQLRPVRTVVKVFTDSTTAIKYLEDVQAIYGRPAFKSSHVLALVRAAVWMSHRLVELGASVELRWVPRKSTDLVLRADRKARLWSKNHMRGTGMMPEGSSVFEKVDAQTSAAIAGRLV